MKFVVSELLCDLLSCTQLLHTWSHGHMEICHVLAGATVETITSMFSILKLVFV